MANKSPEAMKKQIEELSNALRAETIKCEGAMSTLREITKAFAYVLREKCGGKLSVSFQTLDMAYNNPSYSFDIDNTPNGDGRIYQNRSMKVLHDLSTDLTK